MILVTGGRGRIARATVARLRAAGERVRVGSRRPADLHLPADVEVVGVDLARTEDWSSVLDGVTGALLYADPSGVDSFVDAARSADVARITLVSASVADSQAATDSDPIDRMHRAAEMTVRASGVPWTFLRPGGLATNTLGWRESIRAERVVRAPYPHAHSALVHEDDVADIATLTLTDTDLSHEGRCYEITGPASLSQQQQVQHIAAAIGDEVRFEEVSPEEYRRTLSQWGDDSVVDTLIERLRQADGRPDTVSPTFRTLTGRPGRPFPQWAYDHAGAFR